jgi:hypothetical protein
MSARGLGTEGICRNMDNLQSVEQWDDALVEVARQKGSAQHRRVDVRAVVQRPTPGSKLGWGGLMQPKQRETCFAQVKCIGGHVRNVRNV